MMANLQSLYTLWLTASLYPRFMLALFVLSPILLACIGLVVINYRIAKRYKKYGRN